MQMTFWTWVQVPTLQPEQLQQALLPTLMLASLLCCQKLQPEHLGDLILAQPQAVTVLCLMMRWMTCEISVSQLQHLHPLWSSHLRQVK